MRRTSALSALALCALLAVGACAPPDDTDRAEPASTTSTDGTTSTVDTFEPDLADLDTTSGDPLYIAVTRDAYPDAFANVPTELMVDMVDEVCASLDAGMSALEVIVATTSGVGGADEQFVTALGYLIGAGVAVECPAYMGDFEALAG